MAIINKFINHINFMVENCFVVISINLLDYLKDLVMKFMVIIKYFIKLIIIVMNLSLKIQKHSFFRLVIIAKLMVKCFN